MFTKILLQHMEEIILKVYFLFKGGSTKSSETQNTQICIKLLPYMYAIALFQLHIFITEAGQQDMYRY